MIFKEDWKDKRDGLTGWWHREERDCWALGVTAPRTSALPNAPQPPPTEDVEPFVRHFGAAGTFMLTRLSSETEARRFLDDASGWA